jgi:hypothetical protein
MSMTANVNEKAAQNKAIQNILGFLLPKSSFPANVFRAGWGGYLFFQSDWIFSPDFVEIVSHLLKIERSHVCCLLNVSELASGGFHSSVATFLTDVTTAKDYDDKLRCGGPAKGWLYKMENYACASDGGEWCMYCEKANDIAVIAFRDRMGPIKYMSALERLPALPIVDVVEGGRSPVFPFAQLVPDWRRGLIDNYNGRKD